MRNSKFVDGGQSKGRRTSGYNSMKIGDLEKETIAMIGEDTTTLMFTLLQIFLAPAPPF